MGGLNGHPDSMDLAGWIDGSLDPQASSVIAAHLETCERCRLIVADETGNEAQPGANLPDGVWSALNEHGLTVHVFTEADAPLLADVTPSLLRAPVMEDFFESARLHATQDTVQTLDAAGFSIMLMQEHDRGVALELAGGIDSFWLGIDGWTSRSEVPLESRRQVYRISDIISPERLDTSMVCGGKHIPLVIELHTWRQAAGDAQLSRILGRAAARALASGRITAFARTADRFRDVLPGLGVLEGIMAGWRALYPALWVQTVLLGRRVVRGVSEEDLETDRDRVAALQPWLPFEEELATLAQDTRRRDARSDTAFLNMARQQLCTQVLQYYDETWVDLMADPAIYRIRAWLLYAGGKPGESLHCMEKAVTSARAKGGGSKEMAEICRQELGLLSVMDPGDAERWPTVPQDIFESFWKIGADRSVTAGW